MERFKPDSPLKTCPRAFGRIINYSSAGAMRRSKEFADQEICVALALDASLPPHLNIPLSIYRLNHFSYNHRNDKDFTGLYFEDYVEILGGRIICTKSIKEWLANLEENIYNKVTYDYLTTALKKAKEEGYNLVVGFNYWEKGREGKAYKGHVRLLKQGKQEPNKNKMFVFDIFNWNNGTRSYGYVEITEEIMKEIFPPDADKIEIILFQLDEQSPLLEPEPAN